MARYALRRLPSAILVLFVASILVFFVLRLAPGDPAQTLAGPDASAETVAAINTQLGLDQPLPTQYMLWLTGVLTGKPGNSYILRAPITELIGNSLWNTVELASAAVLLALVIGGATGFALGTSRHRSVQTIVGGLNALAFAMPTYVTGVLLVLLFAVTARILPAGGQGPGIAEPAIAIRHLIMPAVTLSLPTAAILARFLSAAMRQTLDEDYVQTAIAKGVSNRRLILRHVLPNSLPPVLTILGLQIGQLLSGAIIVETIFAWPGLGQLLLQAVLTRDYLLTQDLLLLAVFVFVVVQVLTDLADAAIDPRIRLERR